MPTYDITSPDGKKYRVSGQGSREEALQHLQQQLGGFNPPPAPAPQRPEVPAAAPAEAVQHQQSPMAQIYKNTFGNAGEAFNAATEASQSGLMAGWDDEIGAFVTSPATAAMDWYKGKGWNPERAYQGNLAKLREYKAGRQQAHPVASVAGEVAGGLTSGGFAGKAGLTVMGRAVPYFTKAAPKLTATALAATEGAGYGALQGAGEAKEGERLAGAAHGAKIGAATGAGLQTVGNVIARQFAARATQSSDELATAGRALYDAAEQEGIRYKPNAVQRLTINLRAAAERLNPSLRPKTAGFVDDIVNRPPNQPMSFEEFAELRKRINKELRTAQPDDARTLLQMKNAANNFAERISPRDYTSVVGGDARRAIGFQKDADALWAKSNKTQMIEDIIERAEVAGKGNYTQSGIANAMKHEMRALWKRIQKGQERGWSDAEVGLIKQIAKGGSSSRMINLFAKLAPRGAVSIGIGQGLGLAATPLLGPWVGNVAIPAIGQAAGVAADRAAINAANVLRQSAASGRAPVAPFATNMRRPIAGAVAGVSEIDRINRGY